MFRRITAVFLTEKSMLNFNPVAHFQNNLSKSFILSQTDFTDLDNAFRLDYGSSGHDQDFFRTFKAT